MKRSDELRSQKAQKIEQWEALLEKVKNEKRSLTEDEQTSVKAFKDEIHQLEQEIENAEFLEERQRQQAETKRPQTETRHRKPKESPEDKISKKFSYFRALNMISQRKPLDGVEAELHQEARNEAKAAGITDWKNNGFGIPSFMVNWRTNHPNKELRDLEVGTPSAGGYLVPQERPQLIPALTPRLRVVELGATTLTGLQGNLPMNNEASLTGAVWATEKATSTETTSSFSQTILSPNRLTAFTEFTDQLAAQADPSVEAFVRARLEGAIQRKLDATAINGSGAGAEPAGILNTAGIGDVANGTDGGALDWSDVVSFLTQIEEANADEGTLAWLGTPGVKGQLMTTPKVSGQDSFILPEPGMTLLGSRFAHSTQVPSNLTKGSGTNLHALIYGYWNGLILANWGGLNIVIDEYTKAKEATTVVVVHSWWDMMLRHAANFAAAKDVVIS